LKQIDVSEVHIALMMEAVYTSEISLCINETTRRYIPEDYNIFKVKDARIKWRSLV
jgi:hypothetical protein